MSFFLFNKVLRPDGYARGGGLSNQIEQLLGRIQCAFHEDKPLRTLVLVIEHGYLLTDFRFSRISAPIAPRRRGGTRSSRSLTSSRSASCWTL
jgi:hypothetical protein